MTQSWNNREREIRSIEKEWVDDRMRGNKDREMITLLTTIETHMWLDFIIKNLTLPCSIACYDLV